MKKKLVCIILALALVISVALSGCGSSKNDTGQSPSANSTTAKNTETAEKTEPAEVVFQTWNPAETSCIGEIIASFEEANPDIKIDYKYMPATDHIQALEVAMSSGEGPDVYGLSAGATYKQFRDFEEDITPYAQAFWGNNWTDKFIDFCLSLIEVDGKYYGLPLGLTYAGLAWADVNMLKEYGINELPTSYDALLEASKILRSKGQLPLAIGAKDSWINIDTWMSMAADVNAEKLYSAIEGKSPFTDPDLVKSFEIWQNCFTSGIFQDGATGMSVYNDVNDMFQKEGSIPMMLNGSWAMNMYLLDDTETQKVFNAENADHDIFLIDWNNDGKVCPLTAAVDVILCVNSSSKVKDQAFRWAAYLVNEGQDVLVNEHMEYCPSRADMELNVKGLSEDGKKNLDFIIKNAENNLAGIRSIPYNDLALAVSDQLAALATYDTTPEKAAEAIEAASKTTQR